MYKHTLAAIVALTCSVSVAGTFTDYEKAKRAVNNEFSPAIGNSIALTNQAPDGYFGRNNGLGENPDQFMRSSRDRASRLLTNWFGLSLSHTSRPTQTVPLQGDVFQILPRGYTDISLGPRTDESGIKTMQCSVYVSDIGRIANSVEILKFINVYLFTDESALGSLIENIFSGTTNEDENLRIVAHSKWALDLGIFLTEHNPLEDKVAVAGRLGLTAEEYDSLLHHILMGNERDYDREDDFKDKVDDIDKQVVAFMIRRTLGTNFLVMEDLNEQYAKLFNTIKDVGEAI